MQSGGMKPALRGGREIDHGDQFHVSLLHKLVFNFHRLARRFCIDVVIRSTAVDRTLVRPYPSCRAFNL